MGIQVEFNPDLALRNISEFDNGNRKEEECIPRNLKKGEIHNFLKKGQRNYWIEGEIPLLETKGNQKLSRPLASITLLEVIHFMKDEQIYTKGRYIINEVYNINNPEIHFEGMNKINKKNIK